MIELGKFKPKTVYVIYIAATPEKVWQALTDPDLSQRYFHGCRVEIEPKIGGAFVARFPDGRVNVRGEVVEWSPPRRLATTWSVDWIPELQEFPPCLVRYDIEPSGESVKLTMTESYSWDVPDALLSGGRSGWPAILSSLKSMLETGRPLVVKMEPPKGIMEAVKELAATKPWLQRQAGVTAARR
jgi:uncharacterized protein YndB with AHSA1/START domain